MLEVDVEGHERAAVDVGDVLLLLAQARVEVLVEVVAGREVKRLVDRLDGQAQALVVGQGHLADVRAVAVLLRADVVEAEVFDLALVASDEHGAFAVPIVLERAAAVVGDVVEALRQAHLHAEAGQLGHLAVGHVDGGGDADGAVVHDQVGHRVVDVEVHDFVADVDGLALGGFLPDFQVDDFQVIAGRSPDVGAQLEHLAEIVVGRGAPEVGGRGGGDQVLAFHGVAAQASVVQVDRSLHVAALEGQLPIRLGDLEVAPRRDVSLEILAAREEHLLGGDDVARRDQFGRFPLRGFQVEEILLAGLRFVGGEGDRDLGRGAGLGAGLERAVGHDLIVHLEGPRVIVVVQVGELEMVDQLDLSLLHVDRLEVDALVGFLHLVKARMRRAVGADEAVGAEVLLVYPAVASEIAAIEEVFPAIRVGGLHALVDPVPDESALQVMRVEDDVPVFLEVTRTVTHGVRVFAEDPGAIGVRAVGVGLEALGRGVHPGDEVGIGLVLRGPLALHGAARVALFHPVVSLFIVGAERALVAGRPADDAGVILVSLHHALGAVHVLPQPFGEVGGMLGLVVAVQAVRLDVGLVDHVKAVFVAELEHLRALGIVTHANGVEVETLHEGDVLDASLVGQRVPRAGMVLVDVRAADDDGRAVDPYLPVFHLDLPEARLDGGHLDGLSCAVLEGDGHVVEVRELGAPQLGAADVLLEGDLLLLARSDGRDGEAFGEEVLAALFGERDFDGVVIGRLRVEVAHGHVHVEDAVLIGLVQVAHGEEILDGDFGAGDEIDIPLDAGQAPEVLVFQIRSVAPFEDLDGQEVLALAQMLGDVELRGGLGSL